jgi:hypothetical protein
MKQLTFSITKHSAKKQSSDEQGGVSGAHGVVDAVVRVLRAD